jgi:hypothetical protein
LDILRHLSDPLLELLNTTALFFRALRTGPSPTPLPWSLNFGLDGLLNTLHMPL